MSCRHETKDEALTRLLKIPEHKLRYKDSLTYCQPKETLNPKQWGRITNYKFTTNDYHPATPGPYEQQKFLKPDCNNPQLSKKAFVRHFVEKLEKGHHYESGSMGERRMNRRQVSSGWEERVKRFQPGYDGDFHATAANPGFGRTPYGGHFTNFK